MVEVIQIDPAYGDGAQSIKPAGRLLDGNLVVLRMIRQRDEADKPVALVLERPKLAQVIYSIGQRFNMAKEHGARAAAAHAMPGAMHLQVFIGRFLAFSDGG